MQYAVCVYTRRSLGVGGWSRTELDREVAHLIKRFHKNSQDCQESVVLRAGR